MALDAAALAEVERTCEVGVGPAARAAGRRRALVDKPCRLAAAAARPQVYIRGGSGAAFAAAQEQLLTLGSSVEHIDFLQAIFSQSTNSCAIAVAATSLTRLVNDHWTAFAEGDRVGIR